MTYPTDELKAIPEKWAQPPENMITKLERGRGLVLDYVGHADVTLILCGVDPLWEYTLDRGPDGRPDIHKNGNNWVVWGTITIHETTRPCVGTCKSDKAEVEKELTGDLIRNGAMRFGIATKLWSKLDDATDTYTAEPAADRAISADELERFRANCEGHTLDYDEIMLDAHMSEPPMISEKPALARAFTEAKRNAESPSDDPGVQLPLNGPETPDTDTDTPQTVDPDELLVSNKQLRRIQILFGAVGIKERTDRIAYTNSVIDPYKVKSTKELTTTQAGVVMAALDDDIAAAADGNG